MLCKLSAAHIDGVELVVAVVALICSHRLKTKLLLLTSTSSVAAAGTADNELYCFVLSIQLSSNCFLHLILC